MKTVKQLAAELNISKSTLHRLIQRNGFETIQEGNKRLINETIEKAIIQALSEKTLQGETIQNDSETVQKRFKNDSRNDYQKQYIDSLLAQIEELKADKERIYNDYDSEKKERQTILINYMNLKQENESIKMELAKYKSLVDSQQPVRAQSEPRPSGAATRQRPRAQEQPHKKKSWFDRIFRR